MGRKQDARKERYRNKTAQEKPPVVTSGFGEKSTHEAKRSSLSTRISRGFP